MLLFCLGNIHENSASSSSDSKFYLRQKIITNLTPDEPVDIEELKQIYSSAIIKQIYFISIADSFSNDSNRFEPLLAAIIVSRADDVSVLKEMEKISKTKHLHLSQIPQVIVLEQESQIMSLEDADRSLLEHHYRTRISNILLEHQKIQSEIVEISPNVTQQQQTVLAGSFIETDMILDLSINLSLIEIKDKTNSKDIFLTGSTGFLGSYLLDQLLKQTDANIYCLVRSQTSRSITDSRVFYLQGDLSLLHLGLDDHQYSTLVSNIRSIYHCGAMVNFIKPYSELRSVNVLGTIEIIKLAYRANCRINCISTLSVLHENDQNGYVQSKQVAERLLEQAIERHLPVTIFRPGKILYITRYLLN